MKKLFSLAVVSLVILFAAGCGMKESKAEAEALGNMVFEAVMAGDFEAAAELYSEEFYAEVSKKEWTAMLEDVNSRLGGLKGYTLSSWKVSRKFGFGGGTYFLLLYKTAYAHAEAEETLTMVKTDGELKITAHNISSKELLGTRT